MDLRTYKAPPMFRYCDFSETIMPDGVLLSAWDQPIVLNAGNVVFPSDWTEPARHAFREANDLVQRS